MVKKIVVRYKVDNAESNYTPGMNVSGKIWVESQEAKEITLKTVSVRLRESWEQYGTQKSGNTKTSGWFPRAKVKKGFPVAEKVIIAPGETKEFDFSYELPEWSPRYKKNIRNWWVGLFFLIKTGMLSYMGIRPINAVFVLPCSGSDAPLHIIQGMIMGSQSMIAGDTGGYANSLVDIAGPQLEQNKGPGLDDWLKGIIPSDDSIQKVYAVNIQEDRGLGMSTKWFSLVIATRYGMALIIPKGDDQEYNFWAWTKLNKVTKGSMTKAGSSNLKGHVQVKRGRKTTKLGFLLNVVKAAGEDRAAFKTRKKEFQVEFPNFFKAARRDMLDAEDEITMKGVAGDFDFGGGGSDSDLFPGFSSQPAPVSFDDDPGPATFPGDPIASVDDDDWMEESPVENVPSSVSPPEPSEQDWDWDEFED